MTASDLARRFHETYERLAPEYGYETRRESAVPWDEVPEPNRALMTAVCAGLLADANGVPEVLVTFAKWSDEYLDEGCRRDHHGYCQSHGLDEDCPVGPMREWLAAYLGESD